MARWTLDDIPWGRFDAGLVDPDLLRIIKASSVVEQRGGTYAQYLCGVFPDDPDFQDAARIWASEETRHGEALGRWASLADPGFDHEAACARFTLGYPVDLAATSSVRGSRSGEMIARCIVETGTSSYYAAIAEASREPVLRAICKHIAADEIRHYKLFHTTLERYLAADGLGLWGRLKIAFGRIVEAEDDELCFAYHTANEGDAPYDRRIAARDYARRAYALYRRHHVEHGVALLFKALGLKRTGRLDRVATSLAWWGLRRWIARLERAAA